MGAEVFQLHVVTPTYATCPMSLYKDRQETSSLVFLPYWNATGSSFHASRQHDLLSLLIHNKDFFRCWCATGSSFPDGVRCCLQISYGNQTKRPLVIKHIHWVDNHQMIIIAKHSSLHFMLWRERNLTIFPVVIASKQKVDHHNFIYFQIPLPKQHSYLIKDRSLQQLWSCRFKVLTDGGQTKKDH